MKRTKRIARPINLATIGSSQSPRRRVPVSPRRTPRRGLTLYEVLVALAIFLGAITVLGQSMSTGSRAATQSKLRSQAMLRCEQKLGEVLAGVVALEDQEGLAFADNAPNWEWSVNVENGPTTGLLYVVVTATHTGTNSNANAAYSITRYVRDPEVFAIQAELDAAAQEDANQ